jgi:methyltransferase-like protein/2-polyprenyl-3-methyl-5-hydroxy-6-metoxy-1,4-benzoquinol methylase
VDETVERVRADYDAAPYESHACPESSPGRIEAIAHLFGLNSPEASGARVVEIGCATGGNLIPFAAEHPQARAVGIDLSPVQIERGRELVDAMGLDNVELIVGDIASMDLAPLGQFDYVICHGVYSWVPEHVQNAILPAIRGLLAPNGVAYVSYNVYPGWKSKEIVRDAMTLFGAELKTPEQKVSHARALINLLDDVAPAGGALATALGDYKALGGKVGDYYLLHEELETFHRPCYFLEFTERAGQHGLAYLAEARPEVMFAGNYGAKASERLLEESGHSQVLLEQYLDFVVSRTFRHTLLVHGKRVKHIRYQLRRKRWDKMHFAAQMPLAEGVTRLDESRQQYGPPGESKLITDDPVVKAALDAFNARWPWTLTRQELTEAVRARISSAGIDATAVPQRVDDLLEYLIFRGQTRYRLAPVTPEPGSSLALPRLFEPARRMAELKRGDADASTFNRWHEAVVLSPVDRYLLPLLDGTRDRDALMDALLALARDGSIFFQRDGKRVDDEVALRDALAEQVDTMPKRLAEMKLW